MLDIKAIQNRIHFVSSNISVLAIFIKMKIFYWAIIYVAIRSQVCL